MPPFLLLALLLGSIYGTLFHLWRGRTLQDLFIYPLAAIIGFLFGQGIGNITESTVWLIGPLHLLEATIASWVVLFLIQWLKL
jgi:hypothetical protein